MKNLLLVDIGGTHMRYAISKENENELSHINKLLFHTNTIDKNLIDIVNEHRIDVLIISAAGPKIGSTIEMTNRNYSFNSDEIKKRLNLKECYLINDWESIAHSYDFIKDDIISIKKGEQYNNNNLFLGPGTGLGSALLVNDEVVISTELGNTKNTISKFEENYDVSNNSLNVLEDFISGSAISNIYKIKTDIELSSEEILKQFLKDDPLSKQIINGFIKSLAETLSDLTLTFLPGRGILLAGSLMRSLYPILNNDNFISFYLDSNGGIHKKLLEKTSIGVIIKERTPLYGNLAFYNKLNKS